MQTNVMLQGVSQTLTIQLLYFDNPIFFLKSQVIQLAVFISIYPLTVQTNVMLQGVSQTLTIQPL